MSQTLTIEAIKAEPVRLAEHIARLEAQALASKIHFPEALIDLRPGEHFAGLVIGKDGEPSHYLILLSGEAEDVTWKDAMAWADRQGGEYAASLPARREQALLYANLKEQFKPAWYWSGEQHASGSGYAWSQYFDDGDQSYGIKSFQGRARAVRRLIIE
jgi:hypothetical protein